MLEIPIRIRLGLLSIQIMTEFLWEIADQGGNQTRLEENHWKQPKGGFRDICYGHSMQSR